MYVLYYYILELVVNLCQYTVYILYKHYVGTPFTYMEI